MLNQIACLVYGALVLVMSFAGAVYLGDRTAMTYIIAATALTYVFQTVQEFTQNAWMLLGLWLFIGAFAVAGGLRIFGAL